MFDPFRNPLGTVRMDFSQIEIQCAAHMVNRGEDTYDMYTALASQKFGVPLENITPAMRTAAKKPRPWKHPNWQQAQDRIKRRDIYTYIASLMFDVLEKNITPAMRQAAKQKVYWVLYS